MSELYAKLRADIITAVKARESDLALALRTLDGGIQRVAIDKNTEIDDALVVSIIRKAVKDMQGANEQFAKGGRDDLVVKNNTEIAWLEIYLPAQMDPAQVEALVKSAVAESGAASMKEMGKVMGILKQHPDAGLIDFGLVSKLVRAELG
jgi:uncharacterized protein YqeY|tara:strand:+ start:960 stop:1409 length:450 start_codon:yes stop_codon:yes gene_type:complete